jgi:hypothetical protein
MADETKHTPEPWHVMGDSIVQTSHITRDVWTIPHSDGDLHRIVACVNACAGLPTEALEAGALSEAIQAAQDLFPFGPDHRTSLLRGEVCGRLHDALKRLEPSASPEPRKVRE